MGRRGKAWSLRRYFRNSAVALSLFPVLASIGLSCYLILGYMPGYFASSVSAMGKSVSKEVERYLSIPATALLEIDDILWAAPASTVQPFLDALTRRQGELDSILITDASGIVLAASPRNPSLVGTDYSGQPSFSDAASGGIVLSPPYVDPSDGSVTITAYSRAGPGFAAVSLRLEALSGFLRSIRISSDDNVAVTDRNGLCAAHTDQDYVGEQRHIILPETTRTRAITEGGASWLVSVISIANSDWHVIYFRSTEESRNFIASALALLGVVGLASVGLAAGVARRVQKSFTEPFSDLLSELAVLSSGDYSRRLTRAGVEEFDLIGQSFNTMAESVAHRDDLITRDLSEKVVLLKEIHHRVKNNLQIMASLLNLGSAAIDDPATLEVFRASQDRIYSMALVHELLYESEDFSSVDMGLYIDCLVTYLHDAYPVRSVEVEKNLGLVRLGLDQALPLGLIVNELITNCFKYAFGDPDCAFLGADLSVDEATQEVVLVIRDHGPGLAPGAAPERSGSLGFSLVQGLAKQIGARISWGKTREEETGPGLRTEIRFHRI